MKAARIRSQDSGTIVSRYGPSKMKSLVRACQILKVFRDQSECLRLTDVVARTGLHKSTALRMLSTLVACELLIHVGNTKYKLGIRPLGKRRYRFGCGMQSAEFGFSRAVTESLQRSADAADIDLLILDNQDSPSTALHNADTFVRERVDLIIESQTDSRIAGQICSRFRAASIPVIALEIPHPQTVFYGANNSQAGLIAGRYLARWADAHWQGHADELLLLELPKAGQVPNARILGSMLGVIEAGVVFRAPDQNPAHERTLRKYRRADAQLPPPQPCRAHPGCRDQRSLRAWRPAGIPRCGA